jgi:hypothetical protein
MSCGFDWQVHGMIADRVAVVVIWRTQSRRDRSAKSSANGSASNPCRWRCPQTRAPIEPGTASRRQSHRNRSRRRHVIERGIAVIDQLRSDLEPGRVGPFGGAIRAGIAEPAGRRSRRAPPGRAIGACGSARTNGRRPEFWTQKKGLPKEALFCLTALVAGAGFEPATFRL